MKNLILRTLRQLYAVSEIIILIRWVTPPQKLKIFNLSFSSILKFFSFSNSSTLQNLHCFRRLSSLTIYIYMGLCPTTFTYGYFFKLHFLLSECDRTLPPLCYTQPNLFTNSSCAFYMKLVQNLHCVLSAEEIANGTLKLILSEFSVLPLKLSRIPRQTYLLTHDLTRSPPSVRG